MSEAPAGLPKARRRIFQCSECDEVFVDEESLKRHELTHRPAPSGGDDADDEEEAPAPTPRGRPRDNSGVSAPPAAPGRGAREPAAAVQNLGPEPTGDLLSGGLGPSALDAQLAQLDAERGGLGPMSWEDRPPRGNLFKSIYSLVEEFSEFLFSGLQRVFGAVGVTLVPAIGLALKVIIILVMAGGLLLTGMYVGRRYGPKLMGPRAGPARPTPVQVAPVEADDDLSEARGAVSQFYSAIDKGAYNDAYDLLSPAWKRSLTYESFEGGYRSTRAVRCKIDHARKTGDDIEVDFSLVVDEQGDRKRVTGTYVLTPTSAGWKLDRGSMRE